MKKAYLFFVFLIIIGWHGAIYAKEVQETPVRWFIQVGAFSSLENAVNESKRFEGIIEKTFSSSKYDDPDIVYGNHVFTFEQAGVYRVYIGAYATKQNAEAILSMLPALSTQPHITSMRKDFYDSIAYNYRFTLSETSKAEYEKAWQQLFLSQENVTSFAPYLFIKTSTDKSHRFVYDGKQYFIEIQQEGEWKKYPISELFKEHGFHLKFNSLYWSSENILYFYDFSKIDRKTYTNAYKLQMIEGRLVLSESSGADIAELAKNEDLKQENISTISDFSNVRELLKTQIEFGLDSSNGISSVKCGVERHNFPIAINFEAYFPDEHILLGTSEGFGNFIFSTKTCQFASYPYFIRYAKNRYFRLNGYEWGEFANPSFFIEILNKDESAYTKIFDLGSLFTGHPDFEIDDFVWNGDRALLFTLSNLEGTLTYYKVTIDSISSTD